jgi:1-aminocyclopropane-1-carboxylate deaminase
MPAGDGPDLITELVIPSSAPVSDVADEFFSEQDLSVKLLRLDLIDPVLSGNKAFKLIPNLVAARTAGFDTVLSFGGAYSNHIHALAEAGQRFGFKTIGVIRGDDGQADSHTLRFAASRGMRFIRVSRQDYRRRADTQYIDQLRALLGEFYLIPEGGANETGVRGSMQLASVINTSLHGCWPDEILLACGTGTTMAGLIAGIGEMRAKKLLSNTITPFIRGVAVLKQGEFLRDDINGYLQDLSAPEFDLPEWAIETGYHYGGYARFPETLATFVQGFEQKHGILLDPVYTAKLMSAVYQRSATGLCRPGTRLLLLHTGGLQGRMDAQR